MTRPPKENLFAKMAELQARPAAAGHAPDRPTTRAAPAQIGERKSPDRPVGRRSDPDYCQAQAYLPRALRREVERALLDDEGLDYSGLIERLLRDWLRSLPTRS